MQLEVTGNRREIPMDECSKVVFVFAALRRDG